MLWATLEGIPLMKSFMQKQFSWETIQIWNVKPFMLYISSKLAVWICDSFENNLGIKNAFTKYFKEGCCHCS